MNFLTKIETFINHYLCLIINRLTPRFITKLITYLRSIPSRILALIKETITSLKQINIKAHYAETYQKIISKVEDNKSKSPIVRFKSAAKTPFVMMYQWFSDLNAIQTMTLMSFSCASVFAFFSILYSGNQILEAGTHRAPASAEVAVEAEYQRPDYYKKSDKTFELLSLRIPVYFSGVNELRTMDIDLAATLSNRNAKNLLEKLEFQLRDHFILNLEPIKTEFTLTVEGREIIRQKLAQDIQVFMTINNIEGNVAELKVTYALAN